MKESKSYKTYLGYVTGAVHPKNARKFKKSSPSKKESDLVPVDKELVSKGKQIKRSGKKSSTKPATGIVIREPSVETKSKRKEKVDVTHGKGIELISEVDDDDDDKFEGDKDRGMDSDDVQDKKEDVEMTDTQQEK
nr:hypothetical protein [Tanacetum cinerariifolium]